MSSYNRPTVKREFIKNAIIAARISTLYTNIKVKISLCPHGK